MILHLGTEQKVSKMTKQNTFDLDRPGSGMPEYVDVFERMADGGHLSEEDVDRVQAFLDEKQVVPLMTNGRVDPEDLSQKFLKRMQEGERLWMTIEVIPPRNKRCSKEVGEIAGGHAVPRCAGPFVDRRHAERRRMEWAQDALSHRSLVLVVEVKHLSCS